MFKVNNKDTRMTQAFKFIVKDCFSKCKQIRSFMQTFSHLLKKYLTESSIFVQLKIILKIASWKGHCQTLIFKKKSPIEIICIKYIFSQSQIFHKQRRYSHIVQSLSLTKNVFPKKTMVARWTMYQFHQQNHSETLQCDENERMHVKSLQPLFIV